MTTIFESPFGNVEPGGLYRKSLVAHIKDGVDSIGLLSKLLDRSGNGNDFTVYGYSGNWNAVNYAVLKSAITLAVGKPIVMRLNCSDTTVLRELLGTSSNVGSNINAAYINVGGNVGVRVNNTALSVSGVTFSVGVVYTVTFEISGTVLSITAVDSDDNTQVGIKDIGVPSVVFDVIGATSSGVLPFIGLIPWVKQYSGDNLLHYWPIEGDLTEESMTVYDVVSGNDATIVGTLPFFTVATTEASYLASKGGSHRENGILWSDDLTQSVWDLPGDTVAELSDSYWSISMPTSGSRIQNVMPGYGYTAWASMISPLPDSWIAYSDSSEKFYQIFTDSNGDKFGFAFVGYCPTATAWDGLYTYVQEDSSGNARTGFIYHANTDQFFAKDFIWQKHDGGPSLGKIVCLGDSTTLNYPDYMGHILSNSTVVGAGVGGNTIQQMIDRFNADVAVENPDIIVLMAGTNSIGIGLTEMQSQMTTLIGLCTATGAELYLMEMLPRTRTGQSLTDHKDFNTWLHTLGHYVIPSDARFRVGVNDLTPSYTDDGVHLNVRNSHVFLSILVAEHLGWKYPNYGKTTDTPIKFLQPAAYSDGVDVFGNSLTFRGLFNDGCPGFVRADYNTDMFAADQALTTPVFYNGDQSSKDVVISALSLNSDDRLYAGGRALALYSTALVEPYITKAEQYCD